MDPERKFAVDERRDGAGAGIWIALGGLLFVCGVAISISSRHGFGPLVFAIVIGGGLVALGLALRRFMIAQAHFQRSVAATQKGLHEEAEYWAERATRGRSTLILHAVAVQRALRSINAGELAAAEREADAGLALSRLSLWPFHVASTRAYLLGLRAFLLAARGEHAGAREAYLSVQADFAANLEASAYAALSELLCARDRGREAIQRVIGERRVVLFEHLPPRVRALVRTLWHAARPSASPYRSRPTGGAPGDATLVRAVLPDLQTADDVAEPLIELASPANVARAEAPAGPDRRNPPDRAAPGWANTGPWLRAFAVWGLLVVGFLALWQFFANDSRGPLSSKGPGDGWLGFWIALSVLVCSSLAVPLSRSLRTRGHRRVLQARRWMAEGEKQRAVLALNQLVAAGNDVVAVNAWAVLAMSSERAGAFAAALGQCDNAIQRLQRVASRGNAQRVLRGAVSACRALSLAALDRFDEAERELERMLRDGTLHHALAQYRVRLMRAVRCGDFGAAAELDAKRPPDLPVPYRDELLGELATVVAHGASGRRLRRIAVEVAEMPELGAWLNAVAPSAVASVSSAATAAV